MQTKILSFPSNALLSAELTQHLELCSQKAIQKFGNFTMAISGGSLPAILALALNSNSLIDFSKWHLFYADERLVPLDHEDSNHHLAYQHIYSHLMSAQEIQEQRRLRLSQVYSINAALLSNARKVAKEYTSLLLETFKKLGRPLLNNDKQCTVPKFDVILLGMGPDGHTCSLFPGHPRLDETRIPVAGVEDSPKPPPRRITLTYPVLNSADHVFFVCTGEGKKDVVKAILEDGDQQYPSARVHPDDGELIWFLDQPAASSLKSGLVSNL